MRWRRSLTPYLFAERLAVAKGGGWGRCYVFEGERTCTNLACIPGARARAMAQIHRRLLRQLAIGRIEPFH